MTKDEAVVVLAQEAGLEVRWTDARGKPQTVGLDTLRSVLAALGLSASSRGEIEESRARLLAEKDRIAHLAVTEAGDGVPFNGERTVELESEAGYRKTVSLRETANGRREFRAPRQPGYYRIRSGAGESALAVAPRRAMLPKDIAPARKLAGVAVQIYALRGGTSGVFGDFAALGAFARAAGRAGFDAVMTSPVHALFGAEPGQFSPYSPSTRLFMNPLFADVTLAGGSGIQESRGHESLIDWQVAGRKKEQSLRKTFAQFLRCGELENFKTFCHEGGERLLAHALFESLDAHFRAKGIHGFRQWPRGYESPPAAKVAEFAKHHRRAVEYQLFLQWLAAQSAQAAQKKARERMKIGIISDLAIGTAPEGSHAWSAPQELLRDLHVGAPPDVFNAKGQDWGLTALSPRALYTFGFVPFIATLRAAMRHAGGIRIDHALGLKRLWILPAGASPAEGVYLRYPEREMLRLIALESHRYRAIVIGEDLGTIPEGFRSDLARAGVLGTQVLWFERNRGKFVKPSAWRRDSTATTTTHDLPTLAGWWTGRDISWRKTLGHLREGEGREHEQRALDRVRLWAALNAARCTMDDVPSPENCEPFILAALSYVGRTRSAIAFAPVEDLLGSLEQPNMPGTIDEHPNWRRRLTTSDLFRDGTVRRRIRIFLSARHAS